MSKISELSDGGVIQGGDTLIAVRSGGNVKVTYGGTTTANIDGGTIDGTTIGGTTPAAGNFTTVTADDLTIDGAVVVNSDTTTAITATQNANTDVNGLMGIRINNSAGTTYAAFGNSGAGSVAITAGDAGGTGNTSLSLRTASAGAEAEVVGISSTGIDVTGTVDMDGFTSVGNGTITGDLLIQEGSGFPRITLKDTDGTNTQAFINHSGSDLTLTTQNGTSNGRLIFARFDGTTTTTSGYFDATGKLFLNDALDVTGQVKATSDFIAADSGGVARGYLFGTSGGLFARFNSGGTFQVQESGSTKLTVNSTGIDVTGTVTADGLTVDGSSVLSATDSATNTVTTGLKVGHNTSGTTANGFGSALEFEAENSTYSAVNTHAKIESVVTDQISVHSDLNVYTKYNNSLQKRMSFNNDGDISFYEDTGTTAKLTWDSSAETLIVQGSDAGTAGIFVESSTAGVGARLDTIDATISNTASLTNSLLLDSDNHAIIRMDSNNNGSGDFYITESTSDTARLRIANNGDVSLFEDTGTTAKFYWDASAESLGIGTITPGATLDISDSFAAINLESSTGTNQVQVKVSNTGGGAFFGRENSAGSWFGTGEAYATTLRSDGAYPMIFRVNGGNRLVLDDSGNVGIGTSTTTAIRLTATTATANHIAAQIENSNTADSFGLVVKGGNDANDYAADFRKRDNTTIMRIRGDGLVGINTSGPSSTLDVESPDGTTSSIEIQGGDGNSKNLIFRKASAIQGRIRTVGDALEFGVGSSATEIIRIDADGLKFNGDTAAANALDDYEEGEHVTVLSPSTSGSITKNSSHDTLAYTKIGRVVHIQGRILVSSVSSPVGYVNITLPFAVASLTENGDLAGFPVAVTEASSKAGYSFAAHVQPATSNLRLYLNDTANSGFVGASAQEFQAGTGMWLSFSYITT